MKRRLQLAIASGLLLSLPPLAAQEAAPPSQEGAVSEEYATAASAASPGDVEAVHEALRAVRAGITEAVNAGNLDAVLTFLHPNVVVTWQNGEVSRGHEGVRAYYDRMMTGPDRIVERISINPQADELTILYGGAGVVWGTSSDRFTLTDGMDFTLDGRWSATLVEEGGRWLIGSFHASTNVFDNAVLDEVKRQVGLWAGIGGLVAGLLIGVVLTRVLRRSSPRPAAPPAPR